MIRRVRPQSIASASERRLSLPWISLSTIHRNPEELIVFGLHAVALSRASGCWVALKIVADVADGLFCSGAAIFRLSSITATIEWNERREPWSYQQRKLADPRDSVLAEADLIGPRWEMVRTFNQRNSNDAVEIDPANAQIGFVAAGTAFDALPKPSSTWGRRRGATRSRCAVDADRDDLPARRR